YDVVTRDGGQVLAYQASYANDGAGFYPLTSGYVRGYPGLGTFWMSPGGLVGAEGRAGAGLTVTRYQKQVLGQTVTVVRFQTQTTTGQTVFEFDAATGLLVFNSLSSGPSAAQLTVLSVRTVA